MTKSKSIEPLKQLGVNYAVAMVMPTNDNWLSIPSLTKLAIFQHTPEKAIKSRRVGNSEIKYVKIGYVERALNFVSNFQWGIKIIDKGIKTYKQKKTDGVEIEIFDSWVECDCYIVLDGKTITRSVFGSWKMTKNKAVSDWVVYEAARSQATKSFADTLGIGSDSARNSDAQLKRTEKIKESDDLDLSGFTVVADVT